MDVEVAVVGSSSSAAVIVYPKGVFMEAKRKGYTIDQIDALINENRRRIAIKNLNGPFHCNYNKHLRYDHDVQDSDSFYFKSNGDPSTVCLVHEVQLHSEKNKKAYNKTNNPKKSALNGTGICSYTTGCGKPVQEDKNYCIDHQKSSEDRNAVNNPKNNPKNNATEAHHISNRKSTEKRNSRRKGIPIPDTPLADLLLDNAADLEIFVKKNPTLQDALADPKKIVCVDTVAHNRKREGTFLYSFSSYSHKWKTWFYAYKKGSGWQINRWRAGNNSFKNNAFTISKTEHTANDTMQLYIEFVDGCTVLGYEANDELRINSWLRSGGLRQLRFLDLGRGITYTTHRSRVIFGEYGIVQTPDSILTNIVNCRFENNGIISQFQPALTDISYEVAAAQPNSDPTVDAMRLFNLYYCLYEVLFVFQD